jgi:hypothetical protein
MHAGRDPVTDGVEQAELTELLKALRDAGRRSIWCRRGWRGAMFQHLEKGDTVVADRVVGEAAPATTTA